MQHSESHLERYIQHHQSCIIALADEVLSLLDEEDIKEIKFICPKHSWCNLAKIYYKSLDELLTYIEKYFSKFFNQLAKIPDCYAILSAKELEEKMSVVVTATKDRVDTDLRKIFMKPLNAFIQNPVRVGLSFSQLIYYKTLVSDLVKCTEDASGDLTAAITNKLLYLNFNTSEFLQYYTERIIKQIETNTQLPNQLEQLAYHRKLVSQIHLKPGFAFKPHHQMDIQKKIFLWITEEINYIERKKHLKLIMLPANEPEEPVNPKMATSLSVPQLALFFMLLVENSIIKVPSISQLMKFIHHLSRQPARHPAIRTIQDQRTNRSAKQLACYTSTSKLCTILSRPHKLRTVLDTLRIHATFLSGEIAILRCLIEGNTTHLTG